MLALANLRVQWTSFLAAFLATTFGVALISSTLIVFDSSRPVVQPRLSAASALAVAPQAVDEYGNPADRVPWSEADTRAIADELGALPGVDAVVVDREFYAQPFLDGRPVPDEGAREAGHGWSSLLLGGPARWPAPLRSVPTRWSYRGPSGWASVPRSRSTSAPVRASSPCRAPSRAPARTSPTTSRRG